MTFLPAHLKNAGAEQIPSGLNYHADLISSVCQKAQRINLFLCLPIGI